MSGLSGRKPTRPRDVGDFFSPFFRVAFRSLTKEPGVVQEFNNDETFETTNLAGSTTVEDSSSPKQSTLVMDSRNLPHFAANLEIEATVGAAMRFTLQLTPPYEDAIRILENQLVGFATLVKVQWGYTSNIGSNNILSDIHVFRNSFPQVEFGQDITITLSGFDVVADVGLRNTSKQIYTRQQYPTDFTIITAILQKTGILMDTSAVDPKSAFFATKTDPPTVEQHSTDWQFIRRLLSDNNLNGHAEGSVFKVYSLNQLAKQEAAYRFLWRLNPETKRDIPMMSFNGNPLPALFLPPEGRGLRAITSDPDAGEATASDLKAANLPDQQNIGDVSENSEGDQTNSASAKSLASDDEDDGETDDDEEIGAAITPRPEPRPNVDTGLIHSRPNKMGDGDERAKGIVRGAAFFANATASLTAPGMPDVFPPMLIQVEGVSRLFSGPYTIKSVKHTLGTDGYQMDLELLRHAVVGAPGSTPKGQSVDPPAGDPDAEPEDEDADEGEQ